MIGRHAMDHEERANRFLDAMSAVRNLLAGSAPGVEIGTQEMGQLLDLLHCEAKLVVTPFRVAMNDDEDPPG